MRSSLEGSGARRLIAVHLTPQARFFEPPTDTVELADRRRVAKARLHAALRRASRLDARRC
jgi:hypothetical protein